MHELYVDGASKGNPGRASVGIVIFLNKEEIYREGRYLGDNITCNVAEYEAMLLGLTRCVERGVRDLRVFADSSLTVGHLSKGWMVRAPHLESYVQRCRAQLARIPKLSFQWIPRKKNELADTIANEAIARHAAAAASAATAATSSRDAESREAEGREMVLKALRRARERREAQVRAEKTLREANARRAAGTIEVERLESEMRDVREKEKRLERERDALMEENARLKRARVERTE